MLAPICLFTYNRLKETKETIDSLKRNHLASESNLIIFSDGPKNERSEKDVFKVRDFLSTIDGFKSVKIINSDVNKGLAKSIVSGVTSVINEYGKVIVIEDDLILAKNFLTFLNQSLDYYQTNDHVFSISGFSVKIDLTENHKGDIYFYGRPHSWGWATWKDRWNEVIWEENFFKRIIDDNSVQRRFNKWGTDLTPMLKKSIKGEIDSWYVKFAFNQILKEKITVYPITSKVVNNGFVQGATHCDTYNRVEVKFDRGEKKKFDFISDLYLDNNINKQVLKYKTIYFRAINKLLTHAMKMGVIPQRKTKI